MITIREATDADTPALVNMFNHHYEEGKVFQETPVDVLPPEDCPNITLCAEKDGKLVGFLTGSKWIAPTSPFELHKLVVMPEARRQGVASALMGTFTRMLDSFNFSSTLFVEEHRTGAIDLYRAFGYTQDLDRDADPEEGEPNINMRRESSSLLPL